MNARGPGPPWSARGLPYPQEGSVHPIATVPPIWYTWDRYHQENVHRRDGGASWTPSRGAHGCTRACLPVARAAPPMTDAAYARTRDKESLDKAT